MSDDGSRNDWMWGGAVLAAITGMLAVALTRRKSGAVRVLQGGTNPIVVTDPKLTAGPTQVLSLTVHPGVDDKPGDSYIVSTCRILPKFDGESLTFDIKQIGLKGVKGGFQSDTVTFGSSNGEPDGKATPDVARIPLASTDETDVLTVAVYRKDGSRSSIWTIEVVKNV